MTNKITLETEFVVPDDMDEENVRHILNEFFGDLIETDRFIDARIADTTYVTDAERESLFDLLESVDDDSIEQVEAFVEEYTDE